MSARASLLLLAAVAAAFGVYARFDGIGVWPVAVDEYYILRSVQNVLDYGLPLYPCGGLYTRGLVFQYVTAGLQLGGAAPEFAGRFVAAISSLLTLPAAYLIGRRLHSAAVGVLAVVLLALSVWEVEIARFARMYAPFQAVFAWYIVFFLRYTLDGERRALWAMLGLSLLGVLTWEGGIFLGALNLLPPFLRTPSGKLARDDLAYLAGTLLLFAPIAWFAMADLRMSGTGEELPADFSRDPIASGGAGVMLWQTLASHPFWVMAFVVPAVTALWSIRWLWSLRRGWLVTAGLAAALALALVHQFAATATVLALLLLVGCMQWQDFTQRGAGRYFAALLVSLLYWTAFGLATSDWLEGAAPGFAGKAMYLAYELVRFPDYFELIVRPWGGAMPVLSTVLALTIGFAAFRTIAASDSGLTTERTLLIIIFVMMAAAAASDPPRQETRYIFFLYPLMLLIATTTIVRLVEGSRLPRHAATAAGIAAAAVVFVVTEDFNLSHLANVDTERVNFRMDATRREKSHLLARADVRAAANWLKEHPQPGGTVINAFPSVDFYYPDFDYTYIESDTSRFPAYACRRGTRERWGNLPLLYEASAIESRLATGEQVRVVAGRRDSAEMLAQFTKWQPRVAWQSKDGEIAILEFRGARTRMNAAAERLTETRP